MRFLFSFLTLLALAMSGCGEDKAKGLDGAGGDDGENGDGETAASGLFGAWIGDYTDKDSDATLKLEGAQARAEFKEAQEGEHKFSIEIPNSDILVEGSFVQPDTLNLLLEIRKSNFSTIGLPGATPRVQFQLTGKSLELFNSRFSILLKRDGSVVSNEEDAVPAEGDGTYVGHWECSDRYGNDWNLRVRNDSFVADISHPNAGVLRLNGEVNPEQDDKTSATLKVTGSNKESQVGTTLELTNINDILTVLLTDPQGGQSKFQCDRD